MAANLAHGRPLGQRANLAAGDKPWLRGIGSAFSLIESVVLLAQLLNRFELALLSCADVRPVAIGTVRPSQPVRVKLKVRSR